jgi:predicted permease
MLIRRVKYWLSTAQRDAALRAEMELHIEEKAAELTDQGWNESDARAEARRRFGNLGMKQQESREIWIARYWSDFWQDIRYGARQLIAQPGFTLAAVLALVLGIAVNAILFNVFNALALAPWDIRDAKQAVQVLADRGPTGKGRWSGFSWPHFRYLRDNTQSLAGMTAFTSVGTRVRRGNDAWNASATATSANYFSVIGTGFAAGRGFSERARSIHDPAPEIVLHYDTWMARFGGDPGIVGEWIEMSGHQLQVVGVAAPGFSGPVPTKPQMWVPGGWRDLFDPTWKTIDNPGSCCISVIGRLKPGVSRAAAQAELNTLSAQFLTSVKREPRGVLLTNPSFLANPSTFNRASPIFLVMGVATLLILLLACANVANLQLARATARHREIAVRLSLGASWGRLVRQLLAESLLVSGIAGAASVAVSAWAPEWIVRSVVNPQENLVFRFANDARVLAFIFFATVAAALLFGLAPALGAVRPSSGLREGSRVTSTGRLRAILLAAQVALCAVLVSGTALLVRALDYVRHLDAGFRYEQVIVMSTGLDASGATDEQARALLAPLVERINGWPGVESVAYATVVPFGNVVNSTSVLDSRTNERVSVGFNEISANFFATLRIPLVAGRAFTSADESRKDTAIVNEAAAERLWSGESPLGKTLPLTPPREVIAVARNFGTRGFGSERDPYVWVASKGRRNSRLLIRHAGDAGPLLVELPKHAREMDNRYLASAAPYSDTIAGALRSADVSAAIAGVLGALSLILACVGIYGVAAYNVSQRTREVGVRMALGAQPQAILAMILQQNLRAVLIGAVLGIAGAIGFGRLLTSFLFGLKPTDPLAILVTIAILFGMSAFATWGPARRASRVDPAITLRHE